MVEYKDIVADLEKLVNKSQNHWGDIWDQNVGFVDDEELMKLKLFLFHTTTLNQITIAMLAASAGAVYYKNLADHYKGLCDELAKKELTQQENK